MKGIALAVDLGTTNVRIQYLDLSTGEVIKSIISRNPLPGLNLMDHLHFTMKFGSDTVKRIFYRFFDNFLPTDGGGVERIAISGNSGQLSFVAGYDCTDLAYAGKEEITRDYLVSEFGGAELIIPPCIRREIGSDALGLILNSGMLKDKVSIGIDLGTNTEIALKVEDKIYTASVASGPAIESQGISNGCLAMQGAICDVEVGDGDLKVFVFDDKMEIVPLEDWNGEVKGICGAGLISAIHCYLKLGRREERSGEEEFFVCKDVLLGDDDIRNAFRALCAIRAGLTALVSEAGIDFLEIKSAYLTGSASIGLNLNKFRDLNLVPKSVRRITKLDNTSLDLARKLALNRDYVFELQGFVEGLREKYVRLSSSKTFEKAYILDLALFEEGISYDKYEILRSKLGIQGFPEDGGPLSLKVEDRTSEVKYEDSRVRMVGDFGCDLCGKCAEVCPEDAIEIRERIILNTARCRGFGCLECEKSCEFFKFEEMKELF
ncbi:MAG: ASKHA domain-containing protein [Candidatus Methanospirareceae archaeon]